MDLTPNNNQTNKKPAQTNGFRKVRTYGWFLFAVLLAMHIFAFLAFRWLELRELRLELSDIARSVAQTQSQFFAERKETVVRYPTGVIVLQKNDHDARDGFYEKNIFGEHYLVYSENGNNIIAAKSERNVNEEINKFSLILIVLYFGQAIILLGWWFHLKDQIKELFNVS